jgi:MFS family permease
MSHGWRWLYWIQLILAGAIYLVLTFTVSETYAPEILADRAKRLRKETGDEMHVTKEEIYRRPFKETVVLFVARPFQLLFGELIVLLLSLYTSMLYGLLYMFFVCLPILLAPPSYLLTPRRSPTLLSMEKVNTGVQE